MEQCIRDVEENHSHANLDFTTSVVYSVMWLVFRGVIVFLLCALSKTKQSSKVQPQNAGLRKSQLQRAETLRFVTQRGVVCRKGATLEQKLAIDKMLKATAAAQINTQSSVDNSHDQKLSKFTKTVAVSRCGCAEFFCRAPN